MEVDEDRILERITLLEEKSAHQSITIDELSVQLAEQWKLIDHMQMRFERLSQQFSALEDAALEAPANVKPPHY